MRQQRQKWEGNFGFQKCNHVVKQSMSFVRLLFVSIPSLSHTKCFCTRLCVSHPCAAC